MFYKKYDSFYGNIKDNNFIAITYENNEDTQTINLIKLFEKNGYNYRILGLGENWNGWYGRCKIYESYIKNNLDDDTYVLICDGRDVLINENFNEFFSKAKKIYEIHNKIIFGAETCCCNGIQHFNKDNNQQTNDELKEKLLSYFKKRAYDILPNYKHNFFYLNFGLSFGKAKDYKKLFQDMNIKLNDDDQGLVASLLYNDTNKFYLDYNQEIFSNSIGECPFEYNEKLKKFKNTRIDSYSSILHFPGKNFDCYNKIKDKLLES